MIVRLTEKDNEKLMEYLYEESEINLFIIGDIENYGYDESIIKIWADVNDSNEIKGVLLRYKEFYIVYSKGEFDVEGFVSIMEKSQYKAISGKKEVMLKIRDLIDHDNFREMYFSKVTKDTYNDEDNNLAEKLTLDDIDDMFKLREGIEEFTVSYNRDEIIKEIKDDFRKQYIVKIDGNVVSTASAIAENSKSAMIVGVCTDKNYRKKGYGSMCVRALCKELLEKDKTLCLFYDNPKAGRVYKNIGFEDIDKWCMM
ncbi:GNAT family N-acetyltransferase [Clostridiaceae bacterium M8S5]|nr:GNAT family N-acetyltransferase [Clostridiaceae bacterium M8S5]